MRSGSCSAPLIGLAIAAVLGVGFYHGSRRLNLSTFFRWTGVALIFIAAGLVVERRRTSSSRSASSRSGRSRCSTFPGSCRMRPTAAICSASSSRASFGYSATPEVTTFVVWLTYVVVVLYLFLAADEARALTVPATEVGHHVSRLLERQERVHRRDDPVQADSTKIIPRTRLNSPATSPTAT